MSNQKLQTSDLLLVNRGADSYKSTFGDFKGNVLDSHVIQSPTEPDLTAYPDLTEGTIWVDTNQVPPEIFIWGGSSWSQIEGGGAGIVDPDPTTDIEILPTPLSGDGTQGNPFVLSPVTCFVAGGTVQTLEEITVKNQPPLAPFGISVLSGDNARFSQPVNFSDSQGEWSGHLTYKDFPESTSGDSYTAVLKIGESSVYFDWTVTQVANQTPIIGGDGSTSAPNASPGDTDIDGENLYGTGTGTWADGDGTLRAVAARLPGDNNSIKFGVNGGTIDQTSKAITAGQTIQVQFEESIVNAASDGDVISGALTNDAGYYQEWQMTKKTSAFAFQIAPLVDQELNAVVTTGAQAITGIIAPSTITIDGTPTLTSVEVSVAGGAFTNSFPVTFNPGDTLQARGTTGGDNDTEYTATFDIGGTTSTWSVTTTSVNATIPQPKIILPSDGATDLGTDGLELVSDDYQDNGTGAGAHTSSTWEVYESDIELVPQTSAITQVDDESLWNQSQTWTDFLTKTASDNSSIEALDTDKQGFDGSTALGVGGPGNATFTLDISSLNLSGEVRIASTSNDPDNTYRFYRVNGGNETKDPGGLIVGGEPNWIPMGTYANVNTIECEGRNATGPSFRMIEVGGKVLVNPEFTGAPTGTKLTLTNDKTYKNSDNSEIDGVTIDHSFKAGDKVIGDSEVVVFADSPAFSTTTYDGDQVVGKVVDTGIDNSTKSLVWVKDRTADNPHVLVDSERGNGLTLNTDNNAPQGGNAFAGNELTSIQLLSNGFACGAPGGNVDFRINTTSHNYVAWNFRAAPGFFDIVTYTGQSGDFSVPHSLGQEPGFAIFKVTNQSDGWFCTHKDTTNYLYLNENYGEGGGADWRQGQCTFTDTTIDIKDGANIGSVNTREFVAYLFADTPGLIKCGSYKVDTLSKEIDCGFKPGWVMIKASSRSASWTIFDTKRGLDWLAADTSSEEYFQTGSYFEFTNTGFKISQAWGNISDNNHDYIYIAIAENAQAGEFMPTGVLTEDADKDGPTMKLKDVTGTWVDGLVAVNDTRTLPVPSPTEPISDDYTLVVNSVDDAVNLTEYPLTADDLNPGKAYHSRVKYKDDTAPTAVESAFSDWHWMSTSAAGGSYGNFSTTVYPSTGISEEIDTGIDNTNKSLVWIKSKGNAGHALHSTETDGRLSSNSTSAIMTLHSFDGFTSTGFKIKSGTASSENDTGKDMVAWNFSAAAGFFDVVTYEGTNNQRQVPHSLGAVPGVMIIKKYEGGGGGWYVLHKDNTNPNANWWQNYLTLHSTTDSQPGLDTLYDEPTSTYFEPKGPNDLGHKFVAYLFADNPQGGIKCGSYQGAGTGNSNSVAVGFKPGWVLIKKSGGTDNWMIFDKVRGSGVAGTNDPYLVPNNTEAEVSNANRIEFTDTGFNVVDGNMVNENSQSFIYIAIADPN